MPFTSYMTFGQNTSVACVPCAYILQLLSNLKSRALLGGKVDYYLHFSGLELGLGISIRIRIRIRDRVRFRVRVELGLG